MTVGGRLIDGIEDFADLVLHEIAQALATPSTSSDGVDDALGRGDADVGRDQQLLERFDRVHVHRPRALLGTVGLLDDLFEPTDDLLLRAGKPFTKAIKKSQHQLPTANHQQPGNPPTTNDPPLTTNY